MTLQRLRSSRVASRHACVGIAAAALSLGLTAEASPINYGDFVGDNVMFLDVTENSITDPGEQLFGAPIITADSLVFNTTTFGAAAPKVVNGDPPQVLFFDETDGALTFDLMSDDPIPALSVTESYDYSLFAFEQLGGLGFLELTATVTLTVLEANGNPVTPFILVDQFDFFTLDLTTDVQEGTNIVTGTYSIDLATLAPGTTKAAVAIDNILIAGANEAAVASISKKQVVITTIPEPGTVAILLSGAALTLVRRRRA